MVWRWVADPFGIGEPDEDPDGDGEEFVYRGRFPGHYFDAETGLHYNYFRDYEPQTGRYITVDPLGLIRDATSLPLLPRHIQKYLSSLSAQEKLLLDLNHPFNYAGNNPLRWIDRMGLDRYDICRDFGSILQDICEGCVNTACSVAPTYCCEVDKKHCQAKAGDAKELATCEAQWVGCMTKAGKPPKPKPEEDI